MERKLCPVCGNETRAEAKFCTSCGANIATSAQIDSRPSATKTADKSATKTADKSATKAADKEDPAYQAAHQKTKNPLSRKAKRLYVTAITLLSGLFLYLFVTHLPGGAHPVIANQPEVAMATMYMGKTITPEPIDVQVDGGKITFPLATVLQYHAVAFSITTPTGSVPLLAYVSSDGKLVTSIRMCEPCNSNKFTIEGTELACGNCETRWKLSNLEGIQGSCQKYPPDPIPSIVEGNRVIIEEATVINWKMRI